MQINDLREITYKYADDEELKRYFVLKKDLGNMLEAMIKLHILPGINPYNGGKTSEIVMININIPSNDRKKYWWTSADLDEKSERTAEIINFISKPIYYSKKLAGEKSVKNYISEFNYRYQTEMYNASIVMSQYYEIFYKNLDKGIKKGNINSQIKTKLEEFKEELNVLVTENENNDNENEIQIDSSKNFDNHLDSEIIFFIRKFEEQKKIEIDENIKNDIDKVLKGLDELLEEIRSFDSEIKKFFNEKKINEDIENLKENAQPWIHPKYAYLLKPEKNENLIINCE